MEFLVYLLTEQVQRRIGVQINKGEALQQFFTKGGVTPFDELPNFPLFARPWTSNIERSDLVISNKIPDTLSGIRLPGVETVQSWPRHRTLKIQTEHRYTPRKNNRRD